MGSPDEPTEQNTSESASPDRRTFVVGAGAAALAGLGVAACSSDSAADPAAASLAVADDATAEPTPAPTPTAGSEAALVAVLPTREIVEFRSDRQRGVIQQVSTAGAVLAVDVLVNDREELIDLFKSISVEIERLMGPAGPADGGSLVFTPVDSGLLGPDRAPSDLAIVMSVGSSLFDERFGLGDQMPRELRPMPRFRNDRFVDSTQTDADLAFTISANSAQSVTHAVQQLIRLHPRTIRVRWLQEGYNDVVSQPAVDTAPKRNLLGFKDGTSNPDINDAEEMNAHIWVGDGDGEPGWAVGGSYQAVRIIRMLIEFWSTALVDRQELIIGRHKETGAPLGQADEQEEPAFAQDPTSVAVPPESHMRRANPRTGEARVLRRGFSYVRGVDESGLLDQGLLFLAYQRSLDQGFIAMQQRLDGEPLEDYIKPVGGGFFFALPGPGTGPNGWLGRSLLEAAI